MRPISLEMAQELLLVPRADPFDIEWQFGPLKRVVMCSEDEFRARKKNIIDRYYYDKNLHLCDYDALTQEAPK